MIDMKKLQEEILQGGTRVAKQCHDEGYANALADVKKQIDNMINRPSTKPEQKVILKALRDGL